MPPLLSVAVVYTDASYEPDAYPIAGVGAAIVSEGSVRQWASPAPDALLSQLCSRKTQTVVWELVVSVLMLLKSGDELAGRVSEVSWPTEVCIGSDLRAACAFHGRC